MAGESAPGDAAAAGDASFVSMMILVMTIIRDGWGGYVYLPWERGTRMSFDIRKLLQQDQPPGLPETPHELPYSRDRIEDLIARVREGALIDLRTELLNAVDWRGGFGDTDGKDLSLEDIARLYSFYREKFHDVGAIYIAELLSTELIESQQTRGDFPQSEQFSRLIREEPELWQELRRFFHRKELVTALLVMADRTPVTDD